MNDWKFSKFIKIVIIMQFLILAVAGLNIKGINVPIISQLIGFIYLTFIPGYLILRMLRIHKIGNVNSILFAVGLSIVSIMFIGFTLNMVLPLFGISKPITFIPLLAAMSIYVVILSILSYFIDKNFSSPNLVDTNDLFSPVPLFLCLIPFLAIFGSYAMNTYGNNLISMFLIVLIGLILILVVFNKIPRKWYLFTIWIIAISLVYVSSLISPYIWGWDIQNEYYLANLVLQHSYWNTSLYDAYNSMLSIVMIAPIYSLLTNMNLDMIFKLLYPFLFSLMPLGLYKIFKNQTGNLKVAFLAVFLFMSFNTFYIELLSLSREMIAELFLVLLLLLIFNRKFKPNLLILLILFSMGLVVSHYSLDYFFITALISVILMLGIFNLFSGNINLKNRIGNILVLPFLAIFMLVFTYLWYSFFSQSMALNAITDVSRVVRLELTKRVDILILKVGLTPDTGSYLILVFLVVILLVILSLIVIYMIKDRRKESKPSKTNRMMTIHDFIREKLNYKIVAVISVVILLALSFLIGPPKTWIVSVLRYLNYVVIFFSLTGVLLAFLSVYKNKFQKEFLAFSVIAVLMLIAGIFIPSFEKALNITRIYEISFIFLSPFCVIGGIKIFGYISAALNKGRYNKENALKLFSIFLLIFMLFNVGFFSVISGQSIPMHLSGQNIASDYYPRFDHQESLGAQWVSENKINVKIYADVYGVFLFYRYFSSPNEISANNGVYAISTYNDNNSYIFLRKLNNDNNVLYGFTDQPSRNRVYKDISGIINQKNKIYDNGDSKIYFG